MGVGFLSLEIQRSCQASQQASVLGKEGRFEAQNAPASQTLIVWSSEPETIFVPSGENCTDMIAVGSAFVTSAVMLSVATAKVKGQLCQHKCGEGRTEKRAHHPRL